MCDKGETCDKDKKHAARIAQCDEIQKNMNMNMTGHAARSRKRKGRESDRDKRHRKGGSILMILLALLSFLFSIFLLPSAVCCFFSLFVTKLFH